jgi:hypothetical protein
LWFVLAAFGRWCYDVSVVNLWGHTMFRRRAWLALSLLMCLAVPLAESAPKKGDDKTVLYLPTTVGDKRIMEQTWNGMTNESTEYVTAVETKDGMTLVSFAREEGGPTIFQYGASADGVFAVAAGTVVYDTPHRLLKLPAEVGETWEVVPSAPPGKTALTFKYTTGKEEEVEVPAGKFKAVPVEMSYMVNGSVLRTTCWHAPGIGVVQSVLHVGGGGDRVQVLKAFIPATKK